MLGAALLIGNSRYETLPPLHTPAGDVDYLGERLREIGFETIVVRDARAGTLNQSISTFRETVDSLPPESRVLLYFAGHGVQDSGENYLLPIDVDPPRAGGSWALRSLSLSALLTQVCWRGDQQKLIALDACRVSGIPSTTRNGDRGLVEAHPNSHRHVHETMIMFAAAPGEVASDGGSAGTSPFCRALWSALERPYRPLGAIGAEVARLVRAQEGHQVPWVHHNFIDTYEWDFAGPAPIVTPPPPVLPRKPAVQQIWSDDAAGHRTNIFIQVTPGREADLDQALNAGPIGDFGEYGTIVFSCPDDEMNERVAAHMREHYDLEVVMPARTTPRVAPSPPQPPAQPASSQASSPPPLLAALRQQMGRSRWKWIVLLIPPQNRMPFAVFADRLLDIDKKFDRPQTRGVMGDVLDALLGTHLSAFNLDTLALYGTIVAKGEGAYIPADVQTRMAREYGVAFDWADWSTMNGVAADCRRLPG